MRSWRVFQISTVVVALSYSFSATAAPSDTTADAVLGQASFTANLANEGSATPTANSLSNNRGLTIDRTTGRLWVCDDGNNRVLSWANPASFASHAAADIVLGQADFVSGLANRGSANPSANTLADPRTVAFDSAGRLYVADSGNKRILRFDPPFTNGMNAIQVFGQAGSFNTANQAAANAATADNLGNPDGVAVDSAGNLYLADLFLHRVLIYTTTATTDTTADFVVGQINFTTAQRNQNDGNPVPAANTLNNPEGVAIDANDNLYVVDQGNNRVLFFGKVTASNPSATAVFGQPDFTTGTPGASATTLNTPVGAGIDPVSGNLYIADSINNRLLEFATPNTNRTATRVFGQVDFTSHLSNTGGVSATTMADMAGVVLDAKGNLYAGDRNNHRVLRFDAPLDTDGDGIPDSSDNCPTIANPDQADADNNGIGTACDPNETANSSGGGANGSPTCGAGACGATGGSMVPLMICALLGLRRSRRRPIRARSASK